ncbi:MAG: hypothetical protein K8H85_07470 [Cyclobacteriaceae bacterium]|nr:hypothetical protein [Cyclobacteriaceae bacterium]
MEIVINFIEILLILLLGWYIAYFKNYFKKKGEHLAKKEDLAELTEIVEAVRHDYSKDIESVKANLSLLITRRSSVFEEEKLSIIEFFSQINIWVWDTLKIETNEYFHGNYQELTNKVIKFRDAYNKTNVAFSKMQLLIKDDKFVQSGHEYILKALELHNLVDHTISSLKANLSQEKGHVDVLLKDMGKQKGPISKDDPFKNYLNDTFKEIRLEREKLLKDYSKSYLEKFSPVMRKRDAFIELAKAYLNSDSN